MTGFVRQIVGLGPASPLGPAGTVASRSALSGAMGFRLRPFVDRMPRIWRVRSDAERSVKFRRLVEANDWPSTLARDREQSTIWVHRHWMTQRREEWEVVMRVRVAP